MFWFRILDEYAYICAIVGGAVVPNMRPVQAGQGQGPTSERAPHQRLCAEASVQQKPTIMCITTSLSRASILFLYVMLFVGPCHQVPLGLFQYELMLSKAHSKIDYLFLNICNFATTVSALSCALPSIMLMWAAQQAAAQQQLQFSLSGMDCELPSIVSCMRHSRSLL